MTSKWDSSGPDSIEIQDDSNIKEAVKDIGDSLALVAIPALESIDKNKILQSWCGTYENTQQVHIVARFTH